MRTYFDKNKRIFGLPKAKRNGNNTSPTKTNGAAYLHKVVINGCKYYKIHIARQSGKFSKIKYFKRRKDAVLFLEMLNLNPYL